MHCFTRKRIVAGAALLIVLCLILTPWLLHQREVERELALIRIAGHPIHAAQMGEFARNVAADEDLTALYSLLDPGKTTKSDQEGVPYFDDDVAFPLPGQIWPNKIKTEKLLTLMASSLNLTHEAAVKGGKANLLDMRSANFETVLNKEQKVLSMCRFLMLEALLRAHNSDTKGLAQDLQSVLAISNALENEPLAVPFLNRMAIDAKALSSLQLLLGNSHIEGTDLFRLQKTFRTRDYKTQLINAYVGERILGMKAFQSLANSGQNVTKFQKMFWPYTSKAHFAQYLRSMREIIEAAQKPWPEAVDAAKLVASQVPVRTTAKTTFLGIPGVLPPDTRDIVWGFSGLGKRSTLDQPIRIAAQNTALNRAADAAIACELFRRKTGQLPASLQSLVPSYLPGLPMDTFCEQPLSYVLHEDGFEISSIGGEETDPGAISRGAVPPSIRIKYSQRLKTNQKN